MFGVLVKMKTLFITKESKLSRDSNTLKIETKDKKLHIPISNLEHIIFLNDCTITTKFLALLGADGVRVSFFDHFGWFKGSYEPIEELNSNIIRLKQAEFILDKKQSLNLAKILLKSCQSTMRSNLLYYAHKGNKELKEKIKILDHEANQDKCKDIQTLMGYEGTFKKNYYSCWPLIDPRLDFGIRIKRPPNNQINCLLSYLNGLVYAITKHEIAKTHLDQGFSFLHSPGGSRSSVALDLAELFKPILSDRLIWRFIRKNEISDSWFNEEIKGVCMLNEIGRVEVAKKFNERLEEKFDEVSLRDKIRKTCMSLQKKFLINEDFEPYKETS